MRGVRENVKSKLLTDVALEYKKREEPLVHGDLVVHAWIFGG